MTLKDCDNCLVYGSDKRPLARARVVQLGVDEIQLFFSSYKLRIARRRTIVDFYDGQQGLVRSLCELVLKKNQSPNRIIEPWMADGTILKVNDVLQRQKDLRVKVHINLECITPQGYRFTGIIQNISAGGVFLAADQKMNPGQLISFRHAFKEEPVEFSVRVIRRQEILAQGGYGYGCQFVDLSSRDESDIRKFVYNKQIEKQLKRKTRNQGIS